MINALPTIGGDIGGFINNIVPMAHQSYTASQSAPPKAPAPTPGTPAFTATVKPVDPTNQFSPRPVPTNWQPAIAAAYQKYPSLPRGMLESILMKESSMGTDPSGYNQKNGESAWLAGLTSGAASDLAKRGMNPNFNSQQGAIAGMADYIAKRQSGVDNSGKPFMINDPVQLYFQRYKTAVNPTTTQEMKNFKNYMNYYGQNSIASSGRSLPQNQ